jgi:hypothetical protein
MQAVKGVTNTAGTVVYTPTTWTYASNDTVAEMVAAINKVSGFHAVLNPECDGDIECFRLENIEDVDIKFNNDTRPRVATDKNRKPRLYLEPIIPNEAHKIIIKGVVEAAKYRDRELTAAQIKNSEYQMYKQQFCNVWKWRNGSVTPLTIRDIYSGDNSSSDNIQPGDCIIPG